MKRDKWKRIFCSTCLPVAVLGMSSLVQAQDPPRRQPASAADRRLGLDVFGGVGLSWPAAKDSFDALDLNSKAFDVGGGARVTGLWRKLFAQVTMTRWSDSGERAFVASDGTSFPLGIPLEVKATFIDATLGVKDVFRRPTGRISYLSYIGAGAGVIRYQESSPFAEPGDDLDTSEPSYHVLVGVEVPIKSWLAVAVDGRYRYIPRLLGDGGASAVLDEDSLGGFQTSVGLRLGFGGPRYFAPPPKRSAPIDAPVPPPPIAVPALLPEGVIAEAAPVFLLPDAARTPLRTLPAGTTVSILEAKGDWVRIEFNDIQYGRRVGYVQRRFVQMRQTP